MQTEMVREFLSLWCVLQELLLVVGSFGSIETGSFYVAHLGGSPSGLVVSPDRIYTSTTNTSAVFNLSLSASSRYQFTNSESNIVAMARGPGHQVVVCFYDESCHAVRPIKQKNSNQMYSSFPMKDVFFSRGSTLFIDQSDSNSKMYLGNTRFDSSGYKWMQLGIIRIESDNTDLKTSSSIIQNVQVTSKDFLSRSFLFNFYSGNFSYIVARDHLINGSAIKVLRFSQTDSRGRVTQGPIAEVELLCNTRSENFTIISHSKINRTIILGLNGHKVRTFCTFDIADIDQTIHSTVSKCMNGHYKFSLPWSPMQLSCSSAFTKVGTS